MGFTKYTKYSYYLLLVYCTSDVLSESVIAPCKIDDDSCINTSVQAAIPKILAGFPELGVKSSDPLYIERIEGRIPGFTYIFFNTTVTGLKDCVVSNIKVDSQLTNLHYDKNCPGVILEGEYEMTGEIISLFPPVEGKGHFAVTLGLYSLSINSKLETITRDGKTYLNINETKFKSEILSPVKYAFDNLFNGDNNRANEFINAIHENWKTIQTQADGPTWQAILDNVMNNVNAYLNTIPLEDMKL